MIIKLFNEHPINYWFQKTFTNAITEVDGLNEYSLTNNDVQNLTNEIFNKYKEKPTKVDFTKKSARVEMAPVSGKYFPPGADVNRNQSYSCAKVIWSFPIIQESKFLYATPTNHSFEKVDADIDNLTTLHIGYQTRYGNVELSEELKKEMKNWIADLVPKMEDTISLINKQISEFNEGMKSKIEERITGRVVLIKRKNKQNDDLANF